MESAANIKLQSKFYAYYYLEAIETDRIGKRIPYLMTTPKHHIGNKYIFQFQGSGGLDLKHLVKESCRYVKNFLKNICGQFTINISIGQE